MSFPHYKGCPNCGHAVIEHADTAEEYGNGQDYPFCELLQKHVRRCLAVKAATWRDDDY